MVETLLANKTKSAPNKEVFTCSAPEAHTVELAGSFTDWDKHPIKMRKVRNGTWRATVELEPGEYEYRFLVDGQWRDDENCSLRRPNVFGEENCIREVK